MNRRAALGIDDQHATARVAFGLRGEERGSQLPLAGAAQRIGLGVVGHQRLRLRQPFSDRVGDAGEIVDLGGVEPHAQPGLGERSQITAQISENYPRLTGVAAWSGAQPRVMHTR